MGEPESRRAEKQGRDEGSEEEEKRRRCESQLDSAKTRDDRGDLKEKKEGNKTHRMLIPIPTLDLPYPPNGHRVEIIDLSLSSSSARLRSPRRRRFRRVEIDRSQRRNVAGDGFDGCR